MFICDGCDAESENYVKCIADKYNSLVTFYKFQRNYGQQHALHFGLGKAKGDLIITMDEDLQHDPADILKLVEKQVEGGYDVVYGRLNYQGETGSRNYMANTIRWTLHSVIPSLNKQYSPFRLVKKEIAHTISKIEHFFPVIDCHIGSLTEKIAFIPIKKHRRPSGKSSYPLKKLLTLGFLMLISYTSFIKYVFITAVTLIVSGVLVFSTATGFSFRELFSNTVIVSGSVLLLIAAYGSVVKRVRGKNRIVVLYD